MFPFTSKSGLPSIFTTQRSLRHSSLLPLIVFFPQIIL
jgi:hypothetical protein